MLNLQIIKAKSNERRFFEIKSKVRSYKRSSNHVYAEEELVYTDNTKPKERDSTPNTSRNKQTEEEQDEEKIKKQQAEQEANYYFFCQKVDINSLLQPGFRERSTLTYLNGCLYLYGGLGEDIRKDIHQFDLKTKEWKKIEFINDFYPSSGMFGHTCIPFRDQQMIIYGGQSQFNTKLKARQCYNEVWGFDTYKGEWQTITGFGGIPEQRRNHSTVIKDHYMITLGGVSGNENYLSDVQILNLDLGRWKNFEYENIFPDGIAFHKMATVFIPKNQSKNKKRQNVFIDRLKVRNLFQKQTSNLKDEGIYCYGGKNKKGKIYNQMMALKFTRTTPSQREDPEEWIVIQTQGKAPSPRFDHSMDYIENINSLVIFGGIGETANKLSNVYYNDVWIFKISTQTWVQINMGHEDNIYRSGHATCVVGSQIYFFGGLSEIQYSNCFLYFIETDTLASYKLKRINQDDDWGKEFRIIDNKSQKKNTKLDPKTIQIEKVQQQNQEKQVQLLEQAKQAANDDQFSWTKYPSNVKSFMPFPTKIQLKSLQPRENIFLNSNSPQNFRRKKSISIQIGAETTRQRVHTHGSVATTPDHKSQKSPVFERRAVSRSLFRDACQSVVTMNATVRLFPQL